MTNKKFVVVRCYWSHH